MEGGLKEGKRRNTWIVWRKVWVEGTKQWSWYNYQRIDWNGDSWLLTSHDRHHGRIISSFSLRQDSKDCEALRFLNFKYWSTVPDDVTRRNNGANWTCAEKKDAWISYQVGSKGRRMPGVRRNRSWLKQFQADLKEKSKYLQQLGATVLDSLFDGDGDDERCMKEDEEAEETQGEISFKLIFIEEALTELVSTKTAAWAYLDHREMNRRKVYRKVWAQMIQLLLYPGMRLELNC